MQTPPPFPGSSLQPAGGKRASPFSPANVVTTELHADPQKTQCVGCWAHGEMPPGGGGFIWLERRTSANMPLPLTRHPELLPAASS